MMLVLLVMMTCTVCVSVSGVYSSAVQAPEGDAEAGDWRNITQGRIMYSTGYMDQPYCVVDTVHKSNVSALSRWVCTVTLNDASEGSAGEHIASFYTEDQGLSWKGPILIHPDLVQKRIDNAYSNIFQANNGRIFVISNANLNNVTTLPNGQKISRTDELGFFVMRYSDDGGETWSKDLHVVPYRSTPIDKNNTFRGSTNMFWNVDQAKARNNSIYFMFTKIGTYVISPPEQGFVVSSDNALTAENVSDIVWSMLPSGNSGVGAPRGYDPATTVAEEFHVVPLIHSNGFFAVLRTNLGFLASSKTSDPTGKTGWSEPTPAQFDMPPLPSTDPFVSLSLKNPRGPITLKRFSNGQYLLLWYNNGWTSYADPHVGSVGSRSRNPYWLSAGREVDGEVLFSQPEVVIYMFPYDVSVGPGYPDFVTDVDGSIWVSETQKTTTRFHLLPASFLDMLWGQHNVSTVCKRNLTVDVPVSSTPFPVQLPSGTFPDFASSEAVGLTIELVVSEHSLSVAGDILFSATAATTTTGGRGGETATKATNGQRNAFAGISLEVTERQGNITFFMGDGHDTFNLTLDAVCTSTLALSGPKVQHSVAFVVDGGPYIVTAMVDGKVCDGSFARYSGWDWFSTTFAAIATPQTPATVGKQYGGTISHLRVYSTHLFHSELVGNHRALAITS